MNPIQERHELLTRRALLRGTTGGIGAAALSSLLAGEASAGDSGAMGATHFPASAKRVIYLHM